jgi:protein gp37
MNKTKIEWADYTWNPVTGCLHGCPYCYARGIARRFAGGGYGKEMDMFIAKYKDDAFKPPYDLSEPQLAPTKDGWYREAPYPFGFEPTLHRYRLKEPRQCKEPQRIFVVSMGDLFGGWVPDKWIEEVFRACEAAPWHTYLFLTKNGVRYEQLGLLPDNKNFWYGTTRTGTNRKLECGSADHGNAFLSIEPILAPLDEGTLNAIEYWSWVILGAETGNRKGKVIPERAWVEDIVRNCDAAGVPVYMKESLEPIMGYHMRREFPEGLK